MGDIIELENYDSQMNGIIKNILKLNTNQRPTTKNIEDQLSKYNKQLMNKV